MSIETRTEGLVYSVQSNKKGDLVSAGAEDGTITLYKIDENGSTPIQKLSYNTSPIFSTVFIEERLVGATHDGHLLVWKQSQSEYVFESVITVFQGCINTIVECKGTVLCGCSDGRVRKVSLTGEVTLESLIHKHGVTSLAVYNDYIISGGMDSSIKILNNEDLAILHDIKEHTKPVRDCKVCDNEFDSFVFASCSDDGTLCIFTEEKDEKLKFSVDRHKIGTPCRKLSWTPLGYALAVGYGKSDVKVYIPESPNKWKETPIVLP
ncbi:protein transport protein SEC13 [Nematocida parisii]|uniref:Uncharacterized protein n=1 Tax=Nematocida parisii (strain ERTm3) TaxID=935791 RepID=I3EJF6_NEMP3|nr:uncharacterized protein NEPG_01116 [Nematocida parisii ERTm1]EIJ89353.1 hypothetical protein NEQG_00123 [Nematocida parisii ERTm3]KAI5127443.1 protein transport protein SEC13 [Nematocida parisii]EIJ94448.1 hypothetical protein NEPG_01116 [Nematocida parisii ERTm1]KAI5129040.1 protein transport protein SEC13 [Nematocida parisii]KAI5141314.1 protein transport protein SEC13 [Nematocida parisii]|eukprot:XP_013058944.1 hypothetical protein NEPG_01116 [Nematocida parisii ERTm1]